MMKKERIGWIDYLKGIAIMAVIMGHVGCWVFTYESNPVLDGFINSFHMPLFMFLSGYVFTPPETRRLLRKCIAFAMPILTIGVIRTFWIGHTLPYLVYDDFKQGYWYLFVLAIFYTVLSLLRIEQHIKKKWHLPFEIIYLIAVYALFLLLKSIIPEPINGMFSLGRSVANFPYFCLGYLCCKYDVVHRVINRYEWVFPVALAYWMLCFIGIIKLELPWHIATIMTCSCAIVTFVYLASCDQTPLCTQNRGARFMMWLGRNSLDIYIYHYFFVTSFHFAPISSWTAETGNHLAEAIFVLLLSLVIALFSILVGKIIRTNGLVRNLVYGEFAKRWVK